MGGVQRVFGSNGVIHQVEQCGHKGWTNLFLRNGSGEQWSLAKKVGLFFLGACVLIILLRSRASVNINHQTTIKGRGASDDLYEKQPPPINTPTRVTDAGIYAEKTVTLDRSVSSIVLNLPATLHIQTGAVGHSSLSISADLNILNVLAADCDETGRLILQTHASIETKTRIEYKLTVSQLEKVQVSENGQVLISELNGEFFSCRVEDGSSISINGGQLDRQIIVARGNGSYVAGTLATRATVVDLEHNAKAYIKTPSQSLEATLKHNSKCYYKGSQPVLAASSNMTQNAQLLIG